jgi:hypothetical protein
MGLIPAIWLELVPIWEFRREFRWCYTLGGYQVLKKWLSCREFDLLGRALHADEATYFAQVVRRITAILLLGPQIDASYQPIIPTARSLSPR